ncbi:MAG: dATP pyrophosphohydrolase [Micavibrio sp.]|nr:dATP pyrophosphohydrolase [Micavibrio sp.]
MDYLTDFLSLDWQILFVYGLTLVVFISFIIERFPPDITAMSALAILLLVGILDRQEAFDVFSNPAPITIGAMFVISAALERTGCVELLGRMIKRMAGKGQLTLMLAFMPFVLIISAFMNNTPVVIILTPVLISLSRSMNIASSKILIPLSYAAIMGGMTTLIGTSTNLLVSGIAIESGVESFTMFEITLPGLMMAGIGFIYMFLIGRFLLPERVSAAGILKGATGKKYIAQIHVPNNSKLVGQEVLKTSLVKGAESWIIDVVRHGDSMKTLLKELTLKAGDRIIIETNAGEMLGLRESDDVTFDAGSATIEEAEAITASENIVVEGIISQNSDLIGKLQAGLGFRRKYGVYVVGVQKTDNQRLYRPRSNVLQAGDTLLLEGPVDGMERLFAENGLINLTVPEVRAIRRGKAPIALMTLLAVVVISSLGILPIATLALAGAGIVVLTKCMDARDIYKEVDWSILFLIFGMLGLATAMQKTGAAAVIVENMVDFSEAYGPIVLLACFYLLTSFLTEIVSNNAVAALLAPIAVSLATALGLDPKPFLVAVMFAASASFATPIGYQTNTFVYAAGGYKFIDFLKVGLPLNILMFLTAIYLIPKFWSF